MSGYVSWSEFELRTRLVKLGWGPAGMAVAVEAARKGSLWLVGTDDQQWHIRADSELEALKKAGLGESAWSVAVRLSENSAIPG